MSTKADREGHDPFAEPHRALYHDLARVRLHWRIFRALFATNKERIDLLNDVAPMPFAVIQDVLYDSVILALCRASDPANSARNPNASVYLLCELAPIPLRDSLIPLADKFHNACKPLRRQRNKYLAHSDHKARLASDYTDGVSRRQIEVAIDSFRTLIRYVASEAFDAEQSSWVITKHAGDEVALLRTIYHGQKRISALRAEAYDLFRQPADPRSEPPEVRFLRELNEKPDWLNYRPPDRHD